MNNFKQQGDRIPFTLSGTVTSGDPLVVGTGLLGIAMESGVSGETIDVAVNGVFQLPKVSGAVITRGQQVLWDVSAASGAGSVDDDQATPATGDFLCGYAWESKGNGDLLINVAINRQAPSVT